MKKFILSCFIFVLFILCHTGVVKAETIITDGKIYSNITWTKENSPYILDDYINIYSDARLTVEPGVQIVAGTSTEDEDFLASISTVGGAIDFVGTQDDRIKIFGIDNIYINSASLNMENVDLMKGGITFMKARGKIRNSTIQNANRAISARLSSVEVTDSVLKENKIGVNISPDQIFMVQDDIPKGVQSNIGGEGNVLAEAWTTPTTSITISGSILENNTEYSAYNMNDLPIIMTNNWWGQSEGPMTLGQNKIKGKIDYEPWLKERPVLPKIEEKKCCSNILFIPGLEGSRIYGMRSSTTVPKRYWEPILNVDVQRLSLNEYGSSTDPKLFTTKPVDKFLGLFGLYDSFMGSLDNLKKDKLINDWKPFAYDWRRPIKDIVSMGEKRATSTENIKDIVRSLASNSQNGKVTIIAHSNGGLVVKELIRQLQEVNEDSLIDKVISVAVPYLGTPKAILSLLHGYDQSIAFGLIMKSSVARELARNMTSAYNLIPSAEYFKNIISPTIVFASTSMAGLNDGSYPLEINDIAKQTDFIVDKNNLRAEPSTEDTTRPIKGNSFLANMSNIWKTSFDNYLFPSNIVNYAIVGYNVATSKAIKYDNKSICLPLIITKICQTISNYRSLSTNSGDGTVVAPSATYKANDIVSLDLNSISLEENKNINHANILESSTTQTVIKNIISNSKNVVSSIRGVSLGSPDYNSLDKDGRLLVSTHSPVSLHVYDDKGRHTGTKDLPKDISSDIYTAYETNIPESSWQVFGEGYDTETYIGLPINGNYTIEVKGEGVGSFSLNIEKEISGNVVENLEYKDIPVTPLTVASTTLEVSPASHILSLSTTTILSVDVDGDGSTDIKTKSGQQIDNVDSLKKIKQSLREFIKDDKKIKNTLDKFDKILEKMLKKNIKIVLRNIDLDRIKTKHKRFQSSNENDKKELIRSFDDFISMFE